MSEIVFITAGTIDMASSRYRAYWPARYIENSAVYPIQHVSQSGLPIGKDTKAVVFQKFANADMMKFCHDSGVKVVWDVCDPSWWFQPDQCADLLNYTDVVTASSKALLDDLAGVYQGVEDECAFIPDAFEPEHYREAGDYHRHPAAGILRFVWYGHENNRFTLLPYIPELERLANLYDIQVTLTIVDSRPNDNWASNYINIEHQRWTLDTEVAVIASHDLAFLPDYPGRWGKLKSDNRVIHAGYCGRHVYIPGRTDMALDALVQFDPTCTDKGKLEKYAAKTIAKQWKAVLA